MLATFGGAPAAELRLRRGSAGPHWPTLSLSKKFDLLRLFSPLGLLDFLKRRLCSRGAIYRRAGRALRRPGFEALDLVAKVFNRSLIQRWKSNSEGL
jgi:hypothetical protein